jgi:hypothetical protein
MGLVPVTVQTRSSLSAFAKLSPKLSRANSEKRLSIKFLVSKVTAAHASTGWAWTLGMVVGRMMVRKAERTAPSDIEGIWSSMV